MQYFVVFFNDFCNLIPANWMDYETNNVFWPPKHVKFNKQKMHLLQPDDDWLTYKCHKRLGPFETLQLANQVEEHCINVSTNEDTDDLCESALKTSQTQTTRKRKKPKYLSDSSEEEQDNVKIIENKSKSTFMLPPSCYQLNLNEDELILDYKSTTDVSEAVNIMETNNVSASMCSEKMPIIVNVQSIDKKIRIEKVQESSKPTFEFSNSRPKPGLSKSGSPNPKFSKQHSIETVTSANVDEEINDANVRPIQDQEVQERNHTCRPLTEERFLIYYKLMNTKLNHLINIMKDRRTEVSELVDEEENLLPNFPLKTVLEFEQFEQILAQSLEVQNKYIREIKMIGGSDSGKFTRATLRFLISDELALQYSWSGQRNTLKFKNTQISQHIVETISKIKSVPRSDIDTCIKKWLQHASDRLKNRENSRIE